jgi:hypothetical protein
MTREELTLGPERQSGTVVHDHSIVSMWLTLNNYVQLTVTKIEPCYTFELSDDRHDRRRYDRAYADSPVRQTHVVKMEK